MTTIVFPVPDTDDAVPPVLPVGSQSLGSAGELEWYTIPASAAIPEEGRVPTDQELAAAYRELPAITQLKAHIRRRILSEVGDLHDLIADQGRQIEALVALTVRLGQVVLGGEELDATLKQHYLARVTSLAQALDTGDLTLRGDMEDPNVMIARMESRASLINSIVGEDYLPSRNEVLS